MTNLEATRLCAVAMGYEDRSVGESIGGIMAFNGFHHLIWNPLLDDAQAMALVKRLRVWITTYKDEAWLAQVGGKAVKDLDLNRAIVYCVAAMQQAKNSAK